MTTLRKIEVVIVDFEGAFDAREVIHALSKDNIVYVTSSEEKEIDWDDDHPLNYSPLPQKVLKIWEKELSQ